MEEKQLIEICRKIVNSLTWDEEDLFESEEFEEHLNKELDADRFKYSFTEFEETGWESNGYDGKYYSRYITYQLVQYDSEIREYPSEDSIVKEYNIYFVLPVTRTGSYYSDWFYSYEKPTMEHKKLVHIPEKIIPAHDEEKWEEI